MCGSGEPPPESRKMFHLSQRASHGKKRGRVGDRVQYRMYIIPLR